MSNFSVTNTNDVSAANYVSGKGIQGGGPTGPTGQSITGPTGPAGTSSNTGAGNPGIGPLFIDNQLIVNNNELVINPDNYYDESYNKMSVSFYI